MRIVILSGKGGTGKSMITSSLAIEPSKKLKIVCFMFVKGETAIFGAHVFASQKLLASLVVIFFQNLIQI